MRISMKTHATHKYYRKKGDKRRPVIVNRPTLSAVAASLRKVRRAIRAQIGLMKPGQPASAYLEGLYRSKLRIQGYLGSLQPAK